MALLEAADSVDRSLRDLPLLAPPSRGGPKQDQRNRVRRVQDVIELQFLINAPATRVNIYGSSEAIEASNNLEDKVNKAIIAGTLVVGQGEGRGDMNNQLDEMQVALLEFTRVARQELNQLE